MTTSPLQRLPLRLRLVAGFVAAMIVVLTAAGAFVYWRVQTALDTRLDEDLAGQVLDLRNAADPVAALTSLAGEGRNAQLLATDGRVLAAGADQLGEPALLSPDQVRAAAVAPVDGESGTILARRHLRFRASPIIDPLRNNVIAVAAVDLSQRDEALRELLGQLALANGAALAVASVVGYRLTRAALRPVERYRSQAAQITAGATSARLDIPDGPKDEISRLGDTFNTLLDAHEQATRRQQQFIDDASHELRTPLTLLATEIELALRRPRTVAELDATLRRLASDTDHLVQLSNDLLTLGAQGSSVARVAHVDVRDVLEASAHRARGQLGSDVERSVHVLAEQGLSVDADRALLLRALGNLVDNAVRHSDGAITVAAHRITSDGGVVLTVHDAGAGMPADLLANASERFHRGDTARTGHGNGLGLAICDAIVIAHHGQLRLCANGIHHQQASADSRHSGLPCDHPESGTTASILLSG